MYYTNRFFGTQIDQNYLIGLSNGGIILNLINNLILGSWTNELAKPNKTLRAITGDPNAEYTVVLLIVLGPKVCTS